MLTKLFEAIDEKVLTTELMESLTARFNEAVDVKAITLAEEMAAEKIAEAIDGMNEKIEDITAKAEQAAAELQTEKEKEISELKDTIIENVDNFLERIVEEFTAEAKSQLDESVKSEKAEMLIEAFSAMCISTGVEVSKIVEAKDEEDVERKLQESISKYDDLVVEMIEKENEISKLLKVGVISEMKEGLSLVEAEKFEKLADMVEFSKSESYVNKLELIKESIKVVETPSTPSINEDVNGNQNSNNSNVKLSSVDERFL